MLTFGGLFAGIGGECLGLERAGMKCAWQVESNINAIRVLEKNFCAAKSIALARRPMEVRSIPCTCHTNRSWNRFRLD